jgi:hypothetical protein
MADDLDPEDRANAECAKRLEELRANPPKEDTKPKKAKADEKP